MRTSAFFQRYLSPGQAATVLVIILQWLITSASAEILPPPDKTKTAKVAYGEKLFDRITLYAEPRYNISKQEVEGSPLWYYKKGLMGGVLYEAIASEKLLFVSGVVLGRGGVVHVKAEDLLGADYERTFNSVYVPLRLKWKLNLHREIVFLRPYAGVSGQYAHISGNRHYFARVADSRQNQGTLEVTETSTDPLKLNVDLGATVEWGTEKYNFGVGIGYTGLLNEYDVANTSLQYRYNDAVHPKLTGRSFMEAIGLHLQVSKTLKYNILIKTKVPGQ